MPFDFTVVHDAVSALSGDTYTYYPSGEATGYEITAVRDSGDRFQEFRGGAYASLFVLRSDILAEPVKGDVVRVPDGREITLGAYRVADVLRDDADGRTLLLQWMRI